MTFPDNFAAEACFSHTKLAAIYDLTDGQRNDLVLYLNLAEEVSAKKILDLGCGTGSLAVQFAKSGKQIIAVDSAEASLHIARRNPHAGTVQWIHGTSERISDANFDLAVMTANVAQVFLTDEDWLKTLTNIKCHNPNDVSAFETGNPAKITCVVTLWS